MKSAYKLLSLIIVFSFALTACSSLNLSPASPGTSAGSTVINSSPTPVVETGSVPSQKLPAADAILAIEGLYEKVYQQVNPSVVNVQVQQRVAATNGPSFDFFGQQGTPQDQIQRGLGSGFVWDKEGHIVTNNHVIDGADKVTVTFPDGTTLTGTVVGADPNSDLAVIKVDAPANLLNPVTLGDSTNVKVGQLAIAIGNPFGLEGTMTEGIISAIGRTLPVNNSQSTGPSYSIPDIIQTDAPINPGNSGGVLVDDQGQVIGVTSAIESPVRANSGIGFAVPSAIVKNVVPSLIKTGKYEYTWLGISGLTITTELAKQMGLKDYQRGVLVGDVTPNGPAEKAGIKGSDTPVTIDGLSAKIGGDVIIRIENQEVNRFEDLISFLARSTTVGQSVKLSILRDKKEETINVKLEARPAEPVASVAPEKLGQTPPLPNQVPPESQNGQNSNGVWLGIKGTDITSDIAKEMNLSETTKGVLVVDVASGSPADEAGLKGSAKTVVIGGNSVRIGGDVITGLDNSTVSTLQDLKSLISEKKDGDEVNLKVIRDGNEMTVKVKLALQK